MRHTFGRVSQWHEGIVAAEENLCGGDEARERRDGRFIGGASNIVIKAFEFVFDSVGSFLGDVLGAVLVHTTEQHWRVSARVRKDEANVLEFRKGAGKKQIGDSAGGILRNLNEYGGNIREECSTTLRGRGVDEHDGFAPVEFLKDRLVIGCPNHFSS